MTDGTNVRELALAVLLSVTRDGEYSHVALSAVLEKYQYLSKQERGFLTRLVEGTLEKMIELDYIINQFSNVKVNKMKPVIRCIIRMGVYQLKYMDGVPASAACNEAVKLAERKGFRSLKGFVNGVLRNISRNLERVKYPDEKEQPEEALSIRCSVPKWMIAQWVKDYGFDRAKSVAESFCREKKTSVRVNLREITPEQLANRLRAQGITVEPAEADGFPELTCGLYLSGYDYLAKIPEFTQGLFSVQDISSMLVVQTAQPKPGDTVIDVCAAPGGKSLHAAEMMQGQGMVEARDLTEYKVSLIEENILRSGLTNIRAVQMDARIPDEASAGRADLVLADLPCSGLGVLRRKPDIRYRMTEEQERELSALQREILSAACTYVKEGGTLMYSTCTIDRMENEENTAWFLESHPEFSLVTERQIFPDEGDADGFYFAKFVKKR